MKRLLFMLTLVGAVMTAGCDAVIEAQTLPVTLHLEWTPNASADQVTAYTFTLDMGTPQPVDPSTCSATVCKSASFQITDTASHLVSLSATNAFGTSTPATVSFTVKISTPSGLKIQKG